MLGRGKQSFTVLLFTPLKSITHLIRPSFLGTASILEFHGEFASSIMSALSQTSICLSKFSCKVGFTGLTFCFKGADPSVIISCWIRSVSPKSSLDSLKSPPNCLINFTALFKSAGDFNAGAESNANSWIILSSDHFSLVLSRFVALNVYLVNTPNFWFFLNSTPCISVFKMGINTNPFFFTCTAASLHG